MLWFIIWLACGVTAPLPLHLFVLLSSDPKELTGSEPMVFLLGPAVSVFGMILASVAVRLARKRPDFKRRAIRSILVYSGSLLVMTALVELIRIGHPLLLLLATVGVIIGMLALPIAVIAGVPWVFKTLFTKPMDILGRLLPFLGLSLALIPLIVVLTITYFRTPVPRNTERGGDDFIS